MDTSTVLTSVLLGLLLLVIICTDSHPSTVNLHRRGVSLQPVRTLLIDNYDSYTYNLWQLLAEVNGIEPLVVYNDAFDCSWEKLLAAVPAFDNIVLSPGPGSPENPADFGLCRAAILQASEPLLGVCLGHQGLAHAYGGRVVRAAEAMHGRLSALQHDRGGLFRGQPQRIAVVRYHSLAVEERSLSPELAVSARSSDGAVMALSHRFKPQFGLQFHPESILTQQGRRYLENFRDITLDRRLAIPPQPPRPLPRPASLRVNKKQKKKRYAFIRQVSPSPSSPRSHSIEPADVFEALFSNRPAAFFLDSGAGAVDTAGATQPADERDGGSEAEGRVAVAGRGSGAGVSYLGAADCEHSHVLEYWGRDNLLRRRGWGRGCSGRSEQLGVNLFQHLREAMAAEREMQVVPLGTEAEVKVAAEEGGPPASFSATFFGYLGYELGREAEALLANPRSSWDSNVNLTSPAAQSDGGDPCSLPLAVLMFPRTYIAYNHSSQAYWVVSFSDIIVAGEEEDSKGDSNGDGEAQARVQAHGAALHGRLEAFLRSRRPLPPEEEAVPLPCSPARPILTADKSRAEYLQDIRSALDHILRGDTYEVCLTAQFRGPLPPLPSPAPSPPLPAEETDTEAEEEAAAKGGRAWQLYRTLRCRNPAPYACYIHYDPPVPPDDLTWCLRDGISICSSSPERYLRIDQDGRMSSKPIKGTARRDLNDAARDRDLRTALARDEKARAENLMIVDLVRNDFGRVCSVGSVRVPALMAVESFATVHQMVSTIEGSLRPQFDAVDAIVATFPGGSMTGAPKKRTMQILRGLESGGRGVYSGAAGFLSLDGRADLSIIIRTALIRNESVSVGAGGAIVALSDPDQEAEEVLLKARSVAGAIGCDVRFAADPQTE